MIALSSAFKNALIAIDIDGKQDFCTLDANSKHAESLLPAIDKMLDENGIKIKDNSSYCVVIGPGSFTGLRIGIALVKGLVCGDDNNKKIYPITSFELMAYSYIKHNNPTEDFTCVINALSGLYFVCTFDKDGKPKSDGRLIEKSELDLIEGKKVGLCEEGSMQEMIEPSPQDLLQLANIREKEGKSCLYNELIPVYLRKSQAESALEQKNQKKLKND